jgi:GNAT superfamily N-acetyltransferase
MMGLLDILQGASNAAASNVSGPVDGLAWLLRKAGVPVQQPVGGSEWMAQRGLTAQPQNQAMGLLGEALGMSAPIAAAAKAPQLARGLLAVGQNAAAPRALNAQRGVIDIEALKAANPGVEFSLLQRGDGADATLAKVVVPKGRRGSGVGSKFMEDLTAAADADKALLRLSPSTDFGATSKARLVEFYKRFGFVQNKGNNRDFAIMDAMYRTPKGE